MRVRIDQAGDDDLARDILNLSDLGKLDRIRAAGSDDLPLVDHEDAVVDDGPGRGVEASALEDE